MGRMWRRDDAPEPELPADVQRRLNEAAEKKAAEEAEKESK